MMITITTKDDKIDNVMIINDNNQTESEIKDDYHTMNELYDHRTILFASLCNFLTEVNDETLYKPACDAWKSKKHSDGTSEEGWFIAGINTFLGQVTYHQKMEYWDLFKCKELETAPEYDGHTSDDVLKRLIKQFC